MIGRIKSRGFRKKTVLFSSFRIGDKDKKVVLLNKLKNQDVILSYNKMKFSDFYSTLAKSGFLGSFSMTPMNQNKRPTG